MIGQWEVEGDCAAVPQADRTGRVRHARGGREGVPRSGGEGLRDPRGLLAQRFDTLYMQQP